MIGFQIRESVISQLIGTIQAARATGQISLGCSRQPLKRLTAARAEEGKRSSERERGLSSKEEVGAVLREDATM